MVIQLIKKYLSNLRERGPRYKYSPLLKRESRTNYTKNTLDGLTILRFTHAYKNAGGTEQHLEDLNRALLQRNKMTIIQFYLPGNGENLNETEEKIGFGTLIRVPMIEKKLESRQFSQNRLKEILLKFRLSNIVRDLIIYNPFLSFFFKRFFVMKKYSRLKREPLNAGKKAREILSRHNVTLLVIHAAGGFGGAQVIHEAQRKNVPYVILTHYSNSRFKSVGYREQAPGAAGVGGVSSKNIPQYIKSRHTNLLNGIDTEFFKKDNARPSLYEFGLPVVILPSRIVAPKGHRDLILAAYQLKRQGVNLKVVFSGRQDQAEFKIELESIINQYNMSDSVIFVGELTLSELRDWYATSEIVALPSLSEGLPRVLIEAQAMEIPVVAYNVGGVSEAMINGKTGYLVKKGDINELALRIKELIADNNKKITMGKAGREFVENQFSFSALAQRHEDWYLSAINKNGSSSESVG